MKNLCNVFRFELTNFIESKSYVLSTVIIALVIALVMFVPRFIDLGLGEESEPETEQTEEVEVEEPEIYAYFSHAEQFPAQDELNQVMKDAGIQWKELESEDAVKKAVKEQKYNIGFVINSLTDYDYYVYNKSMFFVDSYVLEDVLMNCYRSQYCLEHQLDPQLVAPLLDMQIEQNEKVLGKDAEESYWYCYVLVIVIFMIIVIYGALIATAVTSEKSNRSIEVLVTSTSTNSLLFGKVLAGTVASFLQIALILFVALFGYQLNADAWGNSLDMLLKIDPKVLVTFGFFGVTGFLFYAFLYGAMGALVSKTEDVNKSAGSLQMIIMIVYFAVLTQMSNADGIVMKVASFLPVSSYSAMYIRVAMGEVQLWEILLSYVILVASTILIGILGGKIYRMGTLRYGNPIKISAALKAIRKKENQ